MITSHRVALLFLSFTVTAISQAADDHSDWSHQVALPAGEQRIELFNGEDLSGWHGIEEYFSVEDGTIRAANEDAVAASTYLFTEREVRNFRLLLEVKQTMGKRYSTMHSAVAAVGERVTDAGGEFGHRGPLLMFCHDWGIWEAGGRGRVFPPGKKGPVSNPPYEKKGEWNQVEMLVVDDHVGVVANGQLVVDHNYEPGKLRQGPIGLQLHHNKRPQEYHFRGLVLVENPNDELLTLDE